MHWKTQRFLKTTTCSFILLLIAVLLTACGSGGGGSSSGGNENSGNTSSSTSTHTIKLPQTGQMLSAVIGDDGNLQKGVPWPTPRFIDNSNETITDKLTGLMWMKDAGTPTVGDCIGGYKTWQQALDYVACLNTNKYLGHTDWRLPNFNELKSLYSFVLAWNGALQPKSWLEGQGFKNVDINYHSSNKAVTSSASTETVVCFDKPISCNWGYVHQPLTWPVRSNEIGVIELPRTGQTTSYAAGDDGAIQAGVPWPNPRFTVGTGTEVDCITDNLTSLMWARNPAIKRMTWDDSLTYTIDLNLCGHTDWRLPNVNELMSLMNIGKPDWAVWLVTQGFYNPPSQTFWSSNSYYDSIYPARFSVVVDFTKTSSGYIDARDGTYTNSEYVLPVRDK